MPFCMSYDISLLWQRDLDLALYGVDGYLLKLANVAQSACMWVLIKVTPRLSLNTANEVQCSFFPCEYLRVSCSQNIHSDGNFAGELEDDLRGDRVVWACSHYCYRAPLQAVQVSGKVLVAPSMITHFFQIDISESIWNFTANIFHSIWGIMRLI